ncbi:SNAP receptor [Microbotryomycetes sp. JL201]|nr:SNAP receptor [Microbotryomycetes sp. JL201]
MRRTDRTGADDDLEFKQLHRAVSIQIHKINANVSAITKLVDLLGSTRDTPDLRNKLHNLTDATRDVVKDSTADVKRFANWDLGTSNRFHRHEQQKVSSDFQKALQSFQQAQKRSAERQRLFVERAKATIHTDPSSSSANDTLFRDEQGANAVELAETSPLQQQQQQQALVHGVPDSEVEFQEQLIQERENEIEQIEQGITELNQIFKDLGQIVGEQQSMIDNIETNVRNVANDTRNASVQLTEAHAYQRKAGKRMFCLFLVFVLVLTIVLLAVLS